MSLCSTLKSATITLILCNSSTYWDLLDSKLQGQGQDDGGGIVLGNVGSSDTSSAISVDTNLAPTASTSSNESFLFHKYHVSPFDLTGRVDFKDGAAFDAGDDVDVRGGGEGQPPQQEHHC